MSVRKTIINGAMWTTIGTIVVALSQILRLSILARYLDKADFGIIAIISFVLGLTQVFGDLGFSVAIIHKKNVNNNEFNSVFWVQIILYLLLYIVLSLSSPLVAEFYNEPIILALMPIALFDIVFWGVGKLYDTLLQKELRFKLIAIRNIISSILSLIVAVALAQLNYGIYSLIFSTLFYSAFNNIWNFVAGQKDQKIKFHLSFPEVKPFFLIGIYKTGAQILDYFAGKLDILIIGKIIGTEALGVYSLAKEIVLKVIAIIQIIIAKVALPLFAKFQSDINYLKQLYSNLISLVSFLIFPICVFLSVFSNQIVYFLYGPNYSEVATIISLFSVYVMINSITSPEGILASATGQTKLDFKWTIVRVIITPLIVFFAAHFSLNAVIAGQILISVFGFFYVWKFIINRIIPLSLIDYFKLFKKSGIISLTAILMFYSLVHNNYLKLNNEFIQLFVYGGVFIIFYIIVLYFFSKKDVIKYIAFYRNK